MGRIFGNPIWMGSAKHQMGSAKCGQVRLGVRQVPSRVNQVWVGFGQPGLASAKLGLGPSELRVGSSNVWLGSARPASRWALPALGWLRAVCRAAPPDGRRSNRGGRARSLQGRRPKIRPESASQNPGLSENRRHGQFRVSSVPPKFSGGAPSDRVPVFPPPLPRFRQCHLQSCLPARTQGC